MAWFHMASVHSLIQSHPHELFIRTSLCLYPTLVIWWAVTSHSYFFLKKPIRVSIYFGNKKKNCSHGFDFSVTNFLEIVFNLFRDIFEKKRDTILKLNSHFLQSPKCLLKTCFHSNNYLKIILSVLLPQKNIINSCCINIQIRNTSSSTSPSLKRFTNHSCMHHICILEPNWFLHFMMQ